MTSNTENTLKLIEENGYELDFSNVFNQAFDNYKKIALVVGAIMLILVIGFTVIVGGIAGVFVGIGSYTELLTGFDPANQSFVGILISFVASVIGAALFAPLTAGILKIAHLAEINDEFSFSNAFDYYKSAFLKEIFIAVCIISSLGNALGSLINIFKTTEIVSSTDVLLSLSAGLVSALVSFFTFLTIPAIVFGNLTAIPAIKASLLLVRKNFILIFVLLLIGLIFAMIGILGFCIGIFFTLPFFYSLQYIIYRTALPIDLNSEIDEIGNSEF
jgi:hypothetical protein